MNGLSFLMLFFAIVTFLIGFCLYNGHHSKVLFWKSFGKNMTKQKLRAIGTWTMISAIIPLIISIIFLFIEI